MVLLVIGIRCDIIETLVTCHDSPGIGNRMREGRRWEDIDINVFDGGTPRYASHDVCAIWGHLYPG
jgi:hypothetical protein